MYDQQTIQDALSRHERAYKLLLWLNDAFKQKKLPYAGMENVLTSVDAAKAWLRSNLRNLPTEVRPADSDIDAFASSFVSFINTSFEITDTLSVSGCAGCTCCGFQKIGRKHLKVRSLGKNAKATALELKALYLQKLTTEAGRDLSLTDARAFISAHAELARSLAIATYAQELLRREVFSSQGEAVLALWREINEEKPSTEPKKPLYWRSKPKKKFALTAPIILAAEKEIVAALKLS